MNIRITQHSLVEASRLQGQIPCARAHITRRPASASQSLVGRGAHASIAAAPERIAIPLVVTSGIAHGLNFARSSSSSTSRCCAQPMRGEDRRCGEKSIVDQLYRWGLARSEACLGSYVMAAMAIGCDVGRIVVGLQTWLCVAITLPPET